MVENIPARNTGILEMWVSVASIPQMAGIVELFKGE